MSIRFTVLGVPITQGSKTAFVNKHTGRAIVTEGKGAGQQRHKSWREAVRSEAQRAAEEQPGCPLEGPVIVRITFGLPKPQSAPKTKRTWPVKARSGDIDKLARSCLDAITSVVFADDSQVVELHVRKDWATQPGAVIDIEQIDT